MKQLHYWPFLIGPISDSKKLKNGATFWCGLNLWAESLWLHRSQFNKTATISTEHIQHEGGRPRDLENRKRSYVSVLEAQSQ